MWQIKLPVATQALGIYWERVEYSLAYLSFASFNAPDNPVVLHSSYLLILNLVILHICAASHDYCY